MAEPMTPSKLAEILRAEGLTVVEVEGWENHERDDETGKAFGPVHGVMIHHTAGGSSGAVQYCFNGSSDLPGPLCQGVITKDGKVHLISAGRSNHAGAGDPAVHDAVVNESYGDVPPPTNVHDGEPGVDGNDCFYGFECVNLGDGKDPWPDVQLDAIERASAAICRHYGWTAKSVIGHKEWSDWKSDPTFSMKDMRNRIQARIGGKPTTPTPDPKPEPSKPKYQPFPGKDFFKSKPSSPIITAMGKRLVAEGCSRYNSGPGPQWTEADRRSYARWQNRCGWYGSAADGWPGPDSWSRLKVPFVQ